MGTAAQLTPVTFRSKYANSFLRECFPVVPPAGHTPYAEPLRGNGVTIFETRVAHIANRYARVRGKALGNPVSIHSRLLDPEHVVLAIATEFE